MDKLTIDAIGGSALPALGDTLRAPRGLGEGEGFAQVLTRALDASSAQQAESEQLAARFQLGDASVTLEETMLSMQKANLSFQTLVQVRNRVISAYHDIMNMQV